MSARLIEFAKQFLGVPYVWGGTTPKGFDCSGFVQYVYKHALGINISRTTSTQINDGREVGRNQLQPGDLVFTNSGHVTLYIGNNQVIHAPQPGDKVKISNMWAFWRARRILSDNNNNNTNNTNNNSPPGKANIKSVFNADFYSRKYDDLRKAFGNNRNQLYKHFLTYGIKEGRSASQAFDVKYYLESNGDLVNAFGSDYTKAYNHFLTYGYKEGRDLSPVFHLGYYMQNNSDVVKAFGNNIDGIMNHFLTYGMKEGRLSSPNFNFNVYKSKYQDLINAFGNNNKEYYTHYCIYGRNEGRIAK